MARDKQLENVSLNSVIEKRRLDQALNAKEFAILAGISYSTARGWFKLPDSLRSRVSCSGATLLLGEGSGIDRKSSR